MPTGINENSQPIIGLTAGDVKELKTLQQHIIELKSVADSSSISTNTNEFISFVLKSVLNIAAHTVLSRVINNLEAAMSEKPERPLSEYPLVRQIATMKGIHVEQITQEYLESWADESVKRKREFAKRCGLQPLPSTKLHRPKGSKAYRGSSSN